MALSIHFPARNEPDQTRKILRLRIENEERSLQTFVSSHSSSELLGFLNVSSYADLRESAKVARRSIGAHALSLISDHHRPELQPQPNLVAPRFTTHRGGKGDFFHDLFPYIEAFSPQFVRAAIGRYCPDAKSLLDPFGGAGTSTMSFSEIDNSNHAYFCEINPLLQKISDIKAKLRCLSSRERQDLKQRLEELSDSLSHKVKRFEQSNRIRASYSNVFGQSKMFPSHTLSQVLRFRSFLDQLLIEDSAVGWCTELAGLVSLIPASDMQRAGDLRRKREGERARVSSDFCAHTETNIRRLAKGMLSFQTCDNQPILLAKDVRDLEFLPQLGVDVLLTSPPYLNGTNYFRNTKLELWFLGILQNRDDLAFLRDSAITAGINDVRGDRSKGNPHGPHFESLENCLAQLDRVAYDRRIPSMVRWYAYDIFLAFKFSLAQVRCGGTILIDIGDSIYSGVRVPTDELIGEVLGLLNCQVEDKVHLRERYSRGGRKVNQFCIVARKTIAESKPNRPRRSVNYPWTEFKNNLPHQSYPYKKRNWGHPNHSLCSYQGKLKPAIAHWLIKSFFSADSRVFDPFCGVGTVPFEAALAGCVSFGMDLSPAAVAISRAKVSKYEERSVLGRCEQLRSVIDSGDFELMDTLWLPSFNRRLDNYYHRKTLEEIMIARKWFLDRKPWDNIDSLLLGCTMHILHGNRPYALSRRSHPVTPFAPSGEFEYKSLIDKLIWKVNKTLSSPLPNQFQIGKVCEADATKTWPIEITDLDGVVTSPPFFKSTRFYLANWIRMWFSGWSEFEFRQGKNAFLEERQMASFECYDPILRQARERLKKDGILVFHLGKSDKCDMAAELKRRAKYWFRRSEVVDESVLHCEKHGIRDKGTVKQHQYLLLY